MVLNSTADSSVFGFADAPSTYAESRILDNASHHHKLLLRLCALDYAPSVFREKLVRLSEIQAEIDQCRSAADEIQREQRKNAVSPRLGILRKTLLEPKEPEQGPIPRRSLDLADTEERIVRSESERERVASRLREVESLAREHEETQAQLDSLYESIFAGPTDGFPEEDDAELEVLVLEKDLAEHTELSKNAKAAITWLEHASNSAIYAFKQIELAKAPAQSTSKFKFDIASKDCVIRAQQYMMQAINKLKQARLLDSLVVDDTQPDRMIKVMDGILDKKVSVDLSVEIPAAQHLLREAARLVYDEKVKAKRRAKHIHQANVEATKTKLRSAKENLDAIRRAIFLDVIEARDLFTPPTTARSSTPGLSYSSDATSEPDSECTTPIDGHVNRNFTLDAGRSYLGDSVDELPEYHPRTKLYNIQELSE